jgi:hypothetical protein
MRARVTDDRPRAYLAARRISYEVAEAADVGYIPADARLPTNLRKWCDRLIFPLAGPDGQGYAGRSLWGWRPGMDENAHKALLALPGWFERGRVHSCRCLQSGLMMGGVMRCVMRWYAAS